MNEGEAGRPRRCVLLFARSPHAEGRVKGLLRVEALFTLARSRVVEAVDSLVGTDLIVVEPASQRGASFGERLENAFSDACAAGYDAIVMVPGDAPGISGRHFQAAFGALAAHEVVLGPSPDGGVWLIGLRARGASSGTLFEGVPWLTSRVLGVLTWRAPGAFLLETVRDVDLGADAALLRREIRETSEARDTELIGLLDALLDLPGTRPQDAASAAVRAFLPALASPRAPPFPLFTL